MAKKKSSYGGIIEHPKMAEINQFIIESKKQKLSYRDIATNLKDNFGINTSHTTISTYAKDVLKYVEIIDKLDTEINKPINIDVARIAEIKKALYQKDSDWNNEQENPTIDIFCTVLALSEHNLKQHIEGKDRLRPEYIKLANELKKLIGK